MTTNLRTRLAEAFQEFLNNKVNPRAKIPVVLPVGDLAEVAIDTLADGRGVPTLPRYDHALFRAREWFGSETAEEMFAGGGGFGVQVWQENGARAKVLVTVHDGDGHPVAVLRLSPSDARDFALCALATVEHVESGRAVDDTVAPVATFDE